MLDVHAPHEPIHGWRDFLLHIATITITEIILLQDLTQGLDEDYAAILKAPRM